MKFYSGKKKGQERCIWCDYSKTCKPRRKKCFIPKPIPRHTGEYYTIKRGKDKYQRKMVYKHPESGKLFYTTKRNGKYVKRYIKKTDKLLVPEAVRTKTYSRIHTARPKGIRIGRKEQRKGKLVGVSTYKSIKSGMRASKVGQRFRTPHGVYKKISSTKHEKLADWSEPSERYYY